MRATWIVPFAVASMSWVAAAHAEAGREAVAQQLFDDGRKLMAAKRYADACPKFAESQKLDPSGGTLLNLADCYEKNAQLASAWVKFKEAAAAALAANRRDVQKMASQRAENLFSRLSKLTLSVEESDPSLSVELDGSPLSRESWDAPVPIDGGDHVAKASAPGKRPWVGRVHIEVEKASASMVVPRLEREPDSGVALKPTAERPPAVPEQPSVNYSQRTIGLVVGGVGVGAAGFGVVSFIIGLNHASNAKDACGATYPSCHYNVYGAAESENRTARSWALAATVGGVAGAVLVIGGATLYFTASKSRTVAIFQASPTITTSGAGLIVGGAWR